MKTLKQLLLFTCLLARIFPAMADNIVVKNIAELKKANEKARPGDVIILENGEWSNVIISLSCSGTREQPVIFKARTAGKVLITGHSRLELGGNHIVVDGLYFTNGYAGDDAVIDFRISKDKLANDCRVTNCTVKSFNNPKRMDENYWVSFSGKNNRLDHCSFIDKTNMGVLLAVTLEDDRSRENFHSIDHNYFGLRQPLASNGGEIIRVGVSQHCQFNSNTVIADNFFEHCDGETEIISIKSGSNIVRNNLFYECQGGVVLRHGDNNTVENNIFLGNDKEGTGGVRVINRGQWIINNLFYKCRGVDFRSPLSIMNGVPNSPAHRYVQVTNAVVANNSFFQCSPISFGEGSDKERSMPPDNVFFANNIFYNNKDSNIYKVYDAINGFHFTGNKISKELKQQTNKGFERTLFTTQKMNVITVPGTYTKSFNPLPDSLQVVAKQRLKHELSSRAGFTDLQLAINIYNNAYQGTGAKWHSRKMVPAVPPQRVVNCSSAEEIYAQLAGKDPVIINLTAKKYTFNKPVRISKTVIFQSTSPIKTVTSFNASPMLSLFIVSGKGHLTLDKLRITGDEVQAEHFISSDTTGSSHHYNLVVKNCNFNGFDRKNGCRDFFHAFKSMVADSIVIRYNKFEQNKFDHFIMNEEKDDKGYYNAEKIVLIGNKFSEENGVLFDLYRGGNDESTMGPQLLAMNNSFKKCTDTGDRPYIALTGVQKTVFIRNRFEDCFSDKKLFLYKDIVRANHLLHANEFLNSGEIDSNAFVKQQ